MATVATWHASVQAKAQTAGDSLLDVFNSTGSTVVVRVYRIYCNNTGTNGGVNGIQAALNVNRTTAASSGSSITPVTHDTNNSALDAHVSAGSGRTITRTDLFRKLIYSTTSPVGAADSNSSGIADWELLIPAQLVWEAGYNESNVQPIVCRAAQGVELRNNAGSTSSATFADVDMEFTSA